jgi:hypothetical protein
MCILLYCLFLENNKIFDLKRICNDGNIRKKLLQVSGIILLSYFEMCRAIRHQQRNNKTIHWPWQNFYHDFVLCDWIHNYYKCLRLQKVSLWANIFNNNIRCGILPNCFRIHDTIRNGSQHTVDVLLHLNRFSQS